MTLADFQYSIGGVVMGPGTIYRLSNVAGFGLGPKRGKVFANPGADGVLWGREYRDGNTITFEGRIRCLDEADPPAAAYAGLIALRAAFSGDAIRQGPRTTQLLGFKMPGQPERSVAGRPDAFDPDLGQLGIGLVTFSATFVTAAPLTV